MRTILAVTFAFSLLIPHISAADTAPPPDQLKSVVNKAVQYLRANQAEDGSFSKRLGGPGITALVVAGLLRNGVPVDDPMMAKALKYLESSVKTDGGIYERGLANYTTCVAVLALKEANANGRYDAVIKNASKFLKSLQFDEDHQIEQSKVEYGGAGYDGKSRPDLSNTQFFVEALIASGVPKDDPALKRAMIFISRSQNLPGEHNDQPFAKKVADEDRGGFIYTPVNGGQSAAGKNPDGGLRSAGVMTYAGLKSFLYAGVDKNDPRVQAAVKWIKAHYTLTENPGQGQAGLFYYYHVFAKAMDALGMDEFEDAQGVKHAWRLELFDTLKKHQRPDGSWLNPDKDPKFFEGDANLCTGYVLLALSYCREKK